MGAAVAEAAAETPMDPDLRAAATAAAVGGGANADADFSEGTQALLDRLERLADMRDRGLLAADEFETAKEAIMRELESRS
jgi:Short C-terminal domain